MFSFTNKHSGAAIPNSHFELPREVAAKIETIKDLPEADVDLELPLLEYGSGHEAYFAKSYLTKCFEPDVILQKRHIKDVVGNVSLYETLEHFSKAKQALFSELLLHEKAIQVQVLMSMHELGRYLGIQAMAYEALMVLGSVAVDISSEQLGYMLQLPDLLNSRVTERTQQLQKTDKKAATITVCMSYANKEGMRLNFMTKE